MDNNAALFGITRIDHRNTHSWWVRLKYINRKPQIQKSFPDLRHGGSFQSFTAAVDYRNEQAILHNLPILPRTLSWKNRTRKEMRVLQKKHRKRLIKVGTGVEGAKKAYDLGMSRHTCRKVRTGRQDWVMVNNGGWHTPEYEDFEFKHNISNKQYEKIKILVEHYADRFSEAEKSKMISDIMIKLSMGMIEESRNIEGYVKKWVRLRRIKKAVPYHKSVPLDINGDIEQNYFDRY